MKFWLAGWLAMAAVLSGAAFAADATDVALRKFPDVVDVRVQARTAQRFDFDVTVSSPYDTPQRYADGFRVSTPEGDVLGERTLFHDHAGEQPFTRDLYGVHIPPGVRAVIVQARDRTYGYGGASRRVSLPGR